MENEAEIKDRLKDEDLNCYRFEQNFTQDELFAEMISAENKEPPKLESER